MRSSDRVQNAPVQSHRSTCGGTSRMTVLRGSCRPATSAAAGLAVANLPTRCNQTTCNSNTVVPKAWHQQVQARKVGPGLNNPKDEPAGQPISQTLNPLLTPPQSKATQPLTDGQNATLIQSVSQVPPTSSGAGPPQGDITQGLGAGGPPGGPTQGAAVGAQQPEGGSHEPFVVEVPLHLVDQHLRAVAAGLAVAVGGIALYAWWLTERIIRAVKALQADLQATNQALGNTKTSVEKGMGSVRTEVVSINSSMDQFRTQLDQRLDNVEGSVATKLPSLLGNIRAEARLVSLGAAAFGMYGLYLLRRK